MGEIHALLDRLGIEEMRRRSAIEPKPQRLCVEAAHSVMSDEDLSIGVAHAGFAMASLPHRRIEANSWRRDGGPVHLTIEGGQDRKGNPIGVPYGAMARMILLYLQTQAVRTRSRDVEMGASMNAWLKTMGISVGGKTYTVMRDQANRISRCRLTFSRVNANSEIVSNGAFVRDAILPLEGDGHQLSIWREAVRLDEGFYESLIEHPLPLREVALRQIANRSKSIDLYIWLAYRLHVLKEPLRVTWASLRDQFGPDYHELWRFRQDIIDSLRVALSVYPEARVAIDQREGLTLYPSPSPVPERKIYAVK